MRYHQNNFKVGSFDGQYFHLSVPDVLDTYFGTGSDNSSVHYDYDPMHKAGLVDTHIRDDDSFAFLTEITNVIGAVFKNFNWGKNYESLQMPANPWDKYLQTQSGTALHALQIWSGKFTQTFVRTIVQL